MAIVKNENWIRNFDVTNPRRHKNGFTVYQVTSVVFPKSAPEAVTKVVVWKRFNDFKKLYKSLKQYQKQWNISEDLPKMCKKKFLKRFDEGLINERINFALELLNYIGRHQSLFTSNAILKFFSDGYQIPEPCNGNIEVCNGKNTLDMKNDDTDNNISFKVNCEEKEVNDESINCSYSDEDSFLTCGSPDSTNSCHSTLSAFSTKEYNCNSLSNKMVDESLLNTKNENELVLSNRSDLSSNSCDQPGDESQLKIPDNENQRSSSIDLHYTKAILPSTSNEECLKTYSQQEDYLVDAGCYIGQAQKYEAEESFEAAFFLYRSAVSCLLRGAQNDENSSRRDAVRKKADLYLERAKKMYAMHLATGVEDAGLQAGPEPDDLNAFKVKKIIDSKVMVVENAADEKCYVMKVLQKSPCPSDMNKRTVIPYNVPYMVKLYKYFENEDSIFLLLQYAKGGKLWERLYDFTEFNWPEPNYSISWNPQSNGKSIDCGRETFKLQGSENTCTKLPEFNAKNLRDNEEIETDDEYVKVNVEEEEVEEKEGKKGGMKDPEIVDIVKNSQKLLNSVNKTLETSEKLTSNLSKELMDIEMIFESNCRLMYDRPKNYLDPRRSNKMEPKRSRSANPKPRIDKCYSCEDLSESKPRTASNSIDRRENLSKFTSMNSIPRISESVVRNWAAEILVALETLHRHNIVYKDLHPANILFDDSGGILLTFQALWNDVDALVSEEAVAKLYAAPETLSVFPITPAVDWWSFGALLYELLTGKTLFSSYPEGIRGHTVLTFPEHLSPEACSLLSQLLKYEPGERLGSGASGAEDIKCHPFFNHVDWQLIYGIF